MSELFPEDDDPIRWLDWTTRQQSLASSPASSAWVSANAGSGKTHVLTQRVIRLLLAGSRPASILCLTYTKAAASEMSNRVFQRLSEWTALSDDELRQRVAGIEGHEPDVVKLAEARRLFAKALETPGGLKIQTIHAFCESLLHQFPLEANVAGHFSVLDDRAASTLLAEARRSLLTASSAEDDPGLAEAFAHVLDLGDEFGLETLLSDIIANRTAIGRFLAVAERRGGISAELTRELGLDPLDTEESAAASYWPLPGLSGGMLDLYLSLADSNGNATVHEIAYGLRTVAKEAHALKRADYLESIFLTGKGTAKADRSLIAAAMTKIALELPSAIDAARNHVVACRDKRRLLGMYSATKAALTLARRLHDDYEDLKKQRSLLDFEDLIARTADLLGRDGVGAWVHYKLDQGIDHILVDEAQDTSPIQWSVIKSLAEDFFSGSGARPTRRTMFAVGDEKQSIYSFQGARPERFDQESRETGKRIRQADLEFHAVNLRVSFRSTADVLSAVDQVFTNPDNARGLSVNHDAVVHRSSRTGHAGLVEVWDTIAPEAAEQEEDWTAPFDSAPDKAPSAILAGRIAYRIAGMVAGETIVEKGPSGPVEKPIQPGDILVLVRKRDAFVSALTRALKRRDNIPVAGADRLRLTSHIAVQDLLALGRFLLLPQDDLSLAALMKSPLFDFSEDDVFDVIANRPEGTSAWAALNRVAEEQPLRFQATVDRLQHLLALSRQLSPHDLFARILGQYGGRREFLGRLGTEAGDILDEFLTFALDHETSGLPGLQAFVSTLEIESPEVKREQDGGRNEVRIMTVHASKGLEAPIVFLVDSGSKSFIPSHVAKFRLLKVGDRDVPAWLADSSLDNALTITDRNRLQAAAEEEYRRLLYVGMTRAADRLIVCGYRGKTDNPDTWQRMVTTALSADEQRCKAATFTGPDGDWSGFEWRAPGAFTPASAGKHKSIESEGASVLPTSLLRPLPPQKSLPRPLSPSGAGTMIDDDVDDLIISSPLFGETAAGAGIALQKGKLVHRMLQVLVDFAEDEREAAARRYVGQAARFWPAEERTRLVRDVMAVLAHPDLRTVFSSRGQPEVSIMGTLSLSGQDFAISGRVDRLVVDDDRVTVLDYKTNRVPPATAETAPAEHRTQLAIYREILAPLYPGRVIDCVLVYTQTGSVIRLPENVLQQSLAELKTK